MDLLKDYQNKNREKKEIITSNYDELISYLTQSKEKKTAYLFSIQPTHNIIKV